MSDSNYSEVETRRFNVELLKETNDALQKHIPHGQKNSVIRSLLDKALEVCENQGRIAVMDLLDGNFDIVCHTAERLKRSNP